MKAVILAAGKGTRLGDLTKDRPKPLIPLHGRPMLDYVLDSLPEAVSEVILAVGYHGDQIKARYGDRHGNRPIHYRTVELNGTAGALWQVKPDIGHERFLVMHGDDIHLRSEIAACLAHALAYGIHFMPPEPRSLAVERDEQGRFLGWHEPTPEESSGIYVTTGTYVLDHRIFDYDPVMLPSGEFGLPQTIVAMSKDYPVQTVVMDRWLTVTYPQDIVTVEQSLTQAPWHSP